MARPIVGHFREEGGRCITVLVECRVRQVWAIFTLFHELCCIFSLGRYKMMMVPFPRDWVLRLLCWEAWSTQTSLDIGLTSPTKMAPHVSWWKVVKCPLQISLKLEKNYNLDHFPQRISLRYCTYTMQHKHNAQSIIWTCLLLNLLHRKFYYSY